MKVELMRFSLVMVALVFAGACQDDNSKEQSSSATHFLERCGGACPAGLECICDVCTRACASNAACSPIVDGATCVATIEPDPSCTAAPASHVCAVACSSNGDCAGVPAAPECVSGFCRASGSARGADAGNGTDSGHHGIADSGAAGKTNGGGSGPDGSAGNGASSGGGGASANGGDTSTTGGGTSGTSGTSSGNGGNAGASGNGGSGGNNPTATPPVVSGSRLQARFVTASDGARLYKRGVLFDTQLGVDCKYETAADGKTRCLPLIGVTTQQGLVNYTDSNCTDAYTWLYPPPGGCPQGLAKYVYTVTFSGSVCSQTALFHILPVEGTILSNPPTWAKDGSGACRGANASYPGSIPVRLSAEIPATTFVEGTAAVDP